MSRTSTCSIRMALESSSTSTLRTRCQRRPWIRGNEEADCAQLHPGFNGRGAGAARRARRGPRCSRPPAHQRRRVHLGGHPEDAEPTRPRAETGSVRSVGRTGHQQQARSRAADDARRRSDLQATQGVQPRHESRGGGLLFGAAPNRILIAYEQQRLWREIWMDGRALPTAVDVKGAPESRYYGYSVGRWENDTTLVIDSTGLDERPWLDTVGHPRSSMAHVQERYTRVDQYNIQLTVTVNDPKFYTKPWTFMRANFYWMKAQEFPETLCIPSEALEYLDTLAKPSGIQIVP